jgi:hypothetical protein
MLITAAVISVQQFAGIVAESRMLFVQEIDRTNQNRQ